MTPRIILALVLDALVIAGFAALGREQHDSGPAITGALETAWPFLIGGAVGWLVWWLARRSPALGLGGGAVVWLSTVVVGMALRALTGQGTAFVFVLVTLGVTGAFLLGWRAVAFFIDRRR
ncbi:MAG: DUF3054 domain-containing protein [Mobilicoccus sp.]|nr:DUF3054 domain-containing protein [Mobilicoccus sp.]